jgi:hypothetical protein
MYMQVIEETSMYVDSRNLAEFTYGLERQAI